MGGQPGRTGPQTTGQRIPGTSTRPTAEQSMAGIMRASDEDRPAFMRGIVADVSDFRSEERRRLLEGSPYVDDWRTWLTPEGKLVRVDYGCFAWLRDCCFTFEEVSGRVLPLPQPRDDGGGYYNALCHVAARWQTEKLLAIPKSRRMVMSWLFRCLDTWDMLFHPGRYLYIASEDLEKSEELCYRTQFLLNHIPAAKVAPSCIPPIEVTRAKATAGRHDLLNRVVVRHDLQEAGALPSFIQAVAQGDDMRGYGAGRITLEEFASWKRAKAVWAGLMGTRIGSGEGEAQTAGSVVMVGTAVADSFMFDIVRDRIT